MINLKIIRKTKKSLILGILTKAKKKETLTPEVDSIGYGYSVRYRLQYSTSTMVFIHLKKAQRT